MANDNNNDISSMLGALGMMGNMGGMGRMDMVDTLLIYAAIAAVSYLALATQNSKDGNALDALKKMMEGPIKVTDRPLKESDNLKAPEAQKHKNMQQGAMDVAQFMLNQQESR